MGQVSIMQVNINREIDFQLFSSLTRMGSISEYFSSLLIPYSRCLHRNFEFLKKSHFFSGKNNNKIKKWDFLKIQNYGVDIYCKVSTARKNIQRLIPYV